MKRLKRTNKLNYLKDFVRMSDEIRKGDKKFMIVEIISMLAGLLVGVIPLISDFDSIKKTFGEVKSKDTFWIFLFLITVLIISISFLPLAVKAYLKKKNKKAATLKSKIITTFLAAIENTSVNPRSQTNQSVNEQPN